MIDANVVQLYNYAILLYIDYRKYRPFITSYVKLDVEFNSQMAEK